MVYDMVTLKKKKKLQVVLTSNVVEKTQFWKYKHPFGRILYTVLLYVSYFIMCENNSHLQLECNQLMTKGTNEM